MKTGRKWKVKDTIISAKENLAFKEVIGLTKIGSQGLGVNEKKLWSQTNGKDRRDMVIQEVRNEEDNKRVMKGLLLTDDTLGDTTVYWTSWSDYTELDDA